MKPRFTRICVLLSLVAAIIPTLGADCDAAQEAGTVIDALNDFAESYRGFRVEYRIVHGKYDLPEPKQLATWDGVLIWDSEEQKQIEFDDKMNIGNGTVQQRRFGIFIGTEFSVSKGEDEDTEGHGSATGYVKSNGQDPLRPWWLYAGLGMVSLNSEDDWSLTLADTLLKFDFSGTEASGSNLSYRFENPIYGQYAVELDGENRIAGIKIIKTPSNRLKKNDSIYTPPWDKCKLVVTYQDFEYNQFGVCTKWRRTAEFSPKSADQPQQLEWRYTATSVSRVETLNPSNIQFEMVAIAEGSEFSAQDDLGIEYIWSDDQIVRVVDSSTLEAIDGSEFVPARQSGQLVKYLVVAAVFLLLAVSVVIHYRSRRE